MGEMYGCKRFGEDALVDFVLSFRESVWNNLSTYLLSSTWKLIMETVLRSSWVYGLPLIFPYIIKYTCWEHKAHMLVWIFMFDYRQYPHPIPILLMCRYKVLRLKKHNSFHFYWQCHKNDPYSLISEASCSKLLKKSFVLFPCSFIFRNKFGYSVLHTLLAVFPQLYIFLPHLNYPQKPNAFWVTN